MPIIHREHFSRARGTAYVRDALQKVRSHGTSGFGQLRAFLLAFPPLVQGLYYLITGLWPLINIESFQWVTGPKRDLWLVQTVGVLVLVIGATLCAAGYRRQKSLEVVLLALSSALALAGVDCWFVFQGRISAIYLLDAAVELGLVVLWVSAWVEDRRNQVAALPLPEHQPAAVQTPFPTAAPNGNGQVIAPLNR